jgi:hypothetical protein
VGLSSSQTFDLLGNCQGTIAPGQGCSLIVRFARGPILATQVNIFSNAEGSPHAIDVAPFTRLPGEFKSFPQATPSYIDFGTAAVGSPTPSARITITNIGNGPASNFTRIDVIGKHPSDFAVTGTCQVATMLVTGAACTFDVIFTPTAPGPRAAEIRYFDSGLGLPVQLTHALVGYATGGAAQAVEYFNATLDHYFLTHVSNEIAILDAGVQIKGWTRTGQSIPVATSASATTSPVCRMYIPPGLGDSHFYGRGTAECASTAQRNPSFVNEDPQFFHMTLPVAGVCPPGTTPVYRAFSNRTDANHRYMKDKAIRDQMVAKGWVAEGDGADLVVMCSPA